MKGKHSDFELRYRNELLSPSTTRLDDRGLEDGYKLYIHLDTNAQDTNDNSRGSRTPLPIEAQELCLIKVYEYRESPSFSFWIPRNSSASFGSVIFRYWRYNAEERYGITDDDDVGIWTEMRSDGDDHIYGMINRHWEKIRPSTRRVYGAGTLGNEMLYPKDGDPGLDLSSFRFESNVQVFKVKLNPYRSRLAVRRDGEKAQMRMSRVDLSHVSLNCD